MGRDSLVSRNKGTDVSSLGQWDKVKIFLRDGPGRNFDIFPGAGPGWILTACPIPEYLGTDTGQKEKSVKKLQF